MYLHTNQNIADLIHIRVPFSHNHHLHATVLCKAGKHNTVLLILCYDDSAPVFPHQCCFDQIAELSRPVCTSYPPNISDQSSDLRV